MAEISLGQDWSLVCGHISSQLSSPGDNWSYSKIVPSPQPLTHSCLSSHTTNIEFKIFSCLYFVPIFSMQIFFSCCWISFYLLFNHSIHLESLKRISIIDIFPFQPFYLVSFLNSIKIKRDLCWNAKHKHIDVRHLLLQLYCPI